MRTNNHNAIILALSIPLAILVIVSSYAGLWIPETYSQETVNWKAQAIGQDMIDLFLIAPFLTITAWFAFKNKRSALLLWSGGIFYLIYTFVIYCFAIHFNQMFLVYCLILGLSFYSFLYFLYSSIKEPISAGFHNKIPVKTIGAYLFVMSCLFYILWLSDIIPAIASHTIPKNIIQIGMPTNPVHVLDLSICLPGLLITSILLFRKKPLGLLLAPAMLTFCLFMDLTIGGLVIVMNMKGVDADFSLTLVMSVFALISAILLLMLLKSLHLRRE